MIYTAFCQERSGTGTIWIDSVEAGDLESAKHEALVRCAADWEWSPGDIHLLGLVEGQVTVAFWEDLGD